LHLHSFDDKQALSGFNGITRGDQELDDFAGHQGGDFNAAVQGIRSFAGAHGAGVKELDGDWRAIDDGFAGSAGGDTVDVFADQDGERAGVEGLNREFALDEFAIFALVAKFRPGYFDHSGASVDKSIEFHVSNECIAAECTGGWAALIRLKKKTNLGLMTVSVHEAKTQLSRLLDLLEQGEDILILRHGKPVARLVRAKAAAKPQIGAMKGEITWKEGWERAMTDEEADAFWEGR
jgi:prevent-host-death family protein